MRSINGVSLPLRVAEICNPVSTALLIYDMQTGVRSHVSDSDRITDACSAAVAAARKSGMRIVYTCHLSMPGPWIGLTQFRTAMTWQRTDDPSAVKQWFPRGSEASEIVPELAPHDSDLIIEKFSMSAFEGTALSFALRDSGIAGLAIAGIALEIGIEPTVRHATDLGFVPIILTDACGCGNREAADRTIATMRFIGEAMLIDVATFTSLLDGCSGDQRALTTSTEGRSGSSPAHFRG
jgi:biuret amidohydrolase